MFMCRFMLLLVCSFTLFFSSAHACEEASALPVAVAGAAGVDSCEAALTAVAELLKSVFDDEKNPLFYENMEAKARAINGGDMLRLHEAQLRG